MLVRLELPLSLVVALGVLSQLANVLFLRVWGTFVDRYGSKVILSLSSSLYFLVILGWTFTTLPDKYTLTLPLLVVLHILIGIASAGINIASTTIRMKMSPPAESTAYLTGVSLASSIGAGISPLIGGAFVDYFSLRHLQVAVEWVSPTSTVEFPALFLTGYDFLFAIAFVLGLFTLGMLGKIRAKDDILWLGNEEEQLQKELKDVCADYIVVARTRRKTKDDERGPSELEVQTAVDEMRQEVTSAEFVDKLNLETVPPPPVVTATFEALRKATESETPVISETIAGINVSVYLEALSVNDPYVAVDAAQESEVAVIVNMAHPHVSQIEGSMGLLNYLRHCMYDGLAEWQARRKQANLDPDTIKFLKDNLLRLSGEIEAHAGMPNQP